MPPALGASSVYPRAMMLLKRALDSAAVWHRDQLRKYPVARVPYVSHVAGVVAILARHGFSEVVQAAGALHDVIEDQGVSAAELGARFGDEVRDLVVACSEQDRSLPWEERKARYLEAFSHKSWEAQAITLADKIDNLESIVVAREQAEAAEVWSQFKRGREAQLARFHALLERARRLAPHPLVDEYAAAVAAASAV